MKSLGRLSRIIANEIGGAIRDVVLIVVSILIAFGLEAWWTERREQAAELRQLDSVRAEFESAVGVLADYEQSLEAVLSETRGLVQVLTDDSIELDAVRFQDQLYASLNFGFQAPRTSALAAALSSGNFVIEGDEALRGIAENWARRMENLEVDNGHLERNREVDLQEAFIEAGVPGFAVAFDSGADYMFGDEEVLRRLDESLALEATLRYRVLRSVVLLDSVTSAREAAERFLELSELALQSKP